MGRGPIDLVALIADSEVIVSRVDEGRYAPADGIATDVAQRRIASRTPAKCVAPRIEGEAGENFAQLVAEQMMLNIQRSRCGAEALVAGEHVARLIAGEPQGRGGA